jgi:heme A synthase
VSRALIRNLRIELLALTAVAATLALMTLGSIVHGTGSSLACPDWPLCHGSALPAMTGGVQFEHSHRLAALAVAAMTGALALSVWRRGYRAERRLALAACVLVVVQATLGALTVLLLLPPVISVAHLATSMAFLVVLVLLAARLADLHRPEPDAMSRILLGIAASLTYVQIVVGATVRHTGAALACPDLPWCGAVLWPDGFLQRLHTIHRATGCIVLLAVLATVVVARSRMSWKTLRRRHRLLTLVPAALVLCQVVLGVAVVWTGARLPLVTAHHATGALLLASLVLARASC